MAEPTLYLFDGYNLLRAANIEERAELVDSLASFVAVRGARGVVVFDGVGLDERRGALEVRFAPHADALLERLAAEHRDRERVCLVSSDAAGHARVGRASRGQPEQGRRPCRSRDPRPARAASPRRRLTRRSVRLGSPANDSVGPADQCKSL